MLIATAFNTINGNAGFVDVYDSNRDGAVNIGDVMLIATKFNQLV